MKDYGLIPTSILQWFEVRKLPSTHKLLFITIFSKTNSIGVYILDLDYLAIDCGMEKGTLPLALDHLVQSNLIVKDDETGEIFPLKFWSHNSWSALKRNAEKQLDEIQSPTIKRTIKSKIKHLESKPTKPKTNKKKPPSPPAGAQGENDGKQLPGGVDFKKIGLVEEEVETLLTLLTHSQKTDSKFLLKAACCYKSILMDTNVNNAQGCFKARLKSNNLDDAGLYASLLKNQAQETFKAQTEAYQKESERNFLDSIPSHVKELAKAKSATASLNAARRGALQ